MLTESKRNVTILLQKYYKKAKKFQLYELFVIFIDTK